MRFVPVTRSSTYSLFSVDVAFPASGRTSCRAQSERGAEPSGVTNAS